MYLYLLGIMAATLFTMFIELLIVMCGVGAKAKDIKSWDYHLAPAFLFLTLVVISTLALLQDSLFFLRGE